MQMYPNKTIGLPQLKSLIFCPVDFKRMGELLFSHENHDCFTHSLAAGFIPPKESFQSYIFKSSISLDSVPTCFGNSPLEEQRITWQFTTELEQLGESIQYEFTDHTLVTAREILYHPYSVAVPLHLLPLCRPLHPHEERLIQSRMRILPASRNPGWGSLRQIEEVLLSILLNASKNRGNVKLWLSPSADRSKKREACEILEIQTIQTPKSHWSLIPQPQTDPSAHAQARLHLKLESDSPEGVLFENFEINPKTKTLSFHHTTRMLEIVSQLCTSEQPSHQQGAGLEYSLSGQKNILRILKLLNERFRQEGFQEIQRQYVRFISKQSSAPMIWIEKNGMFRFCRKVEMGESHYFFWNFPIEFEALLRGLDGGIALYSESDYRILAQDRKGTKRERDLKILKSSGVFALILFETLNFCLKKSTSLEEFYSELFLKLSSILYDLERKAGFVEPDPAPSLEFLCSKNVIETIRELSSRWMSLIQEQDLESVFTSDGEIQIEGCHEMSFRVLYALLSRVATQSKGQCFLKLKGGVFTQILEGKKEAQWKDTFSSPANESGEIPEQAQLYAPSGPWLPASQTLATLLPLQNRGFKLFYEKMPLDELRLEDIQTEFHLLDPHELANDQKNIDWFALHPKLFFKGVEMNEKQLAQITQSGVLEFQGKVYLIPNKNLPSLRRLEAFWTKIQGNKTIKLRRKTSETYYTLAKNQTLELLALMKQGAKITGGGERWKSIREFYESLDQPRKPLELPSSLRAELKPYQVYGVQWLLDLYHLGLGGILADDMGLGKTIQTLSFLEMLRTQKKMKAALIVVPTSLTYNWLSESARFTPDLPITIFQSKNKEEVIRFLDEHTHGAVICTYGLFTENQDFFSKYPWNILILDEAQNLKNISAKRTTASRSVSAQFKICLTGTPLENHLGEFYSLLDLVVSGSLGDLREFREKFIHPEVIQPDEIHFLKLTAKPLVLRRTKSEILTELPPKLESTIKLPFESKQEKIYRDIALSWNERVKSAILQEGESKSQILMLTALLRLRQACTDPGSIPNVKYTEQPPKLSVLMEALEEITESGESALVFTQFLYSFERIKKALTELKIPVFSLHGGTSRAAREQVLKSFQECPKGAVLLMTLKTGGVGLNLVKASYVFHLEPWWNPAVENQATDRAHRIGQQKPVQVYRYIMKESVEEKIEILKSRKLAKFNALFTQTETEKEISNIDQHLSQTDFEYLLS